MKSKISGVMDLHQDNQELQEGLEPSISTCLMVQELLPDISLLGLFLVHKAAQQLQFVCLFKASFKFEAG